MRPNGYATIVGPDHPVKEMDTFTCGHCNTVVVCHSTDGGKVDIGGSCRICWTLICGPCADKGKCDPFEKKLERMEQRGRLRRELGVG